MSAENPFTSQAGYIVRTPKRVQEFAAWHRPRKQYVREQQWGVEVDWVLKAKTEPGALTYLGLPGKDLLDLRYLYRVFCDGGDQKLRFLGFDRSADPESDEQESFNVSLQELRQLEHVENEYADVRSEDFSLLSDPTSMAWQRAEAFRSFDVVNIDLCGSMGKEQPLLTDSLYTAIAHVIALQRKRRDKWSLLLTTRNVQSHVPTETWKRLIGLVVKNVETCDGFEEVLDEALQVSPEMLKPDYQLSESEFRLLSPVAIAKWLLRLASSAGHELLLSDVVGYSVRRRGSGDLDMLSLAFRMTPFYEIPRDEAGLAAEPLPHSYRASALAIPRVVSQVRDVDKLLAEDSNLLRHMASGMEDLLASARYDREGYRTFVRREFPDLDIA